MNQLQKTLTDMIIKTLETNGLLTPNKTFAIFLEKLSYNTASVFLEQSQEVANVSCPSNGEFYPGDYVLVESINNNPQDRFIVATIRSAVTENLIDFSKLAQEPIRLQRNILTKVVERAFYGEGEYPLERQWNQELHRDIDGLVYAVTSNYHTMSITRYIIKDADGLVVAYK